MIDYSRGDFRRQPVPGKVISLSGSGGSPFIERNIYKCGPVRLAVVVTSNDKKVEAIREPFDNIRKDPNSAASADTRKVIIRKDQDTRTAGHLVDE